jgi:hemerythrin superfamily protein
MEGAENDKRYMEAIQEIMQSLLPHNMEEQPPQ